MASSRQFKPLLAALLLTTYPIHDTALHAFYNASTSSHFSKPATKHYKDIPESMGLWAVETGPGYLCLGVSLFEFIHAWFIPPKHEAHQSVYCTV